MRVPLILLWTILSLFPVSLVLSANSSDEEDQSKEPRRSNRGKRPLEVPVDTGSRKKLAVKPGAQAPLPPASSVPNIAPQPRFINGDLLIDREEIISWGRKNVKVFISKLEQFEIDRIPADFSHELIMDALSILKENNLKYLFGVGHRLMLDPPSDEVVSAFVKVIISDKKFDFVFTSLLDLDPVGFVKLLKAADGQFNNSGVLESFERALKKTGISNDPEAISLAAETAANLKAFNIFRIIYESGLIVRAVPKSSLMTMFSIPGPKDEASFSRLLHQIVSDRKIIPPFELNLLSQAAIDGNYDFLDAVEPHLALFSWEIVLQSIAFALKRGHLSFVEILLGTNSYSNCDYAFRLVSQDEFISAIGTFANTEIISKLVNTVYRNGTTMLISDLFVIKIHIKAVQSGNLEVVGFLLRDGYISIDSRFKGKSTFRMALENGHIILASHMIKEFNYSITDSDTPTMNPVARGGDSLIYVADNKHADFFAFLLRLGANPNAVIIHEEKPLSLVYWCILNGQDLIVKELLRHGCDFNMEMVDKYNLHPEKRDTIKNAILEEEAKRSSGKNINN